jgi:exosortase
MTEVETHRETRGAGREAEGAARKAQGAWLLTIVTLGAFWLLLIYELGAQWTIYQQYNYGWAVPFLCAYLIWQSAGRKVQGASPGAQGATSKEQRALFLLLLCCYGATRFVHEANPVWRLTSLLLALEVIGLTLMVVRFVLGPARVAQVAFPICFFLVAVPWPYPIESFLVDLLTRLNVGTTIELLGLLGVPAVQHGNVIEIGTGMVGIDEACSGIRSFQATLMISLFLGEFYGLRVLRRVVCVLAGFGFAFVFNVGRTLLLTRVASLKGTGAIAAWHDPAGVTILVACFVSLWLLASWLGRQKTERSVPDWPRQKAENGALKDGGYGLSTRTESHKQNAHPGHLLLGRGEGGLQLVGYLLLLLPVWFVVVEGGTQTWYGFHERVESKQQNWSLQIPSGYQTKPVDELITSEFRYDNGLEIEWEDTNKARWQLFYFRWEPARALHRRVRVQRAKMHGPATCLTHLGMTLENNLGVKVVEIGQFKLAVEHYVFAVEGKPFDVFFGIYEDQTGPTALANRRLGTSSRIEAALGGSRNFGQRFLEVAVHGYDKPADAEGALAKELPHLIHVGE